MKKRSHNKIEGIISISSKKGTGYVKAAGYEEDIEIDARHLNTALQGDVVEVLLHSATKKYRQTGEITNIISRAKVGFAGVLEKENEIYFLRPDDTKMYTDILIPKEKLQGAKAGQKVFGEISSWRDPRKAPEGKITKVLGRPGENNAEMEAIALEKGFAAKLPTLVEQEAERIKKQGIQPEDYKNRKDFRKILTLTIDPKDAKDFDDAISFREASPGEYEVGVHIADVTHYVGPGSVIDKEAAERGTSVYLVDRTIPMLPEILSNDLCSLVPGKDRLTMSAVFVLDKEAKVKSEWYGRTVIHSKKRFTYEEAEETIKNQKLPLHKELHLLNQMAKKLTEERFKKGAISLDQEEVKFILDEKGAPLKVVKKERGDSNKLIEEFMLLANRKVAEKISKSFKKNEGVFVYRIHDAPEKEKMENLAFFLKSLGHTVKIREGIISNSEINAILKKLEGKNEKDTVHRAVVRSMAKAIYSTENIGHYGLAFEHYTHFTSPIRRYPDMMVHRMLLDYLAGRKIPEERLREYESLARLSSEQEKRAADAERASIKYKQVEYMSKRLGEKFTGTVSGITEWGIYVEEIETKCEGLVRVRDMDDDFYIFDEKKLELLGQRKKKRYRLGDKVKIKVKNVDLERKTIDYVLI